MERKSDEGWRKRLHEIIFEADTRTGKIFDVILIWAIILSVFAVMAESVDWIREAYQGPLHTIEWVFTILFTLEYLLRILTVKKPWKYITSFYGIIDLLSILPTYLGLFLISGSSLRALRILRLMRIFRVLKLISFLDQSKVLVDSLKASKEKILVFMFAILMLVVTLGTVMYIVEPNESGFTSIPKSIYWSIVTITTVGFGDIYPQTALGQTIASIIMILGYAIIAVPTGFVTAELVKNTAHAPSNTHTCRNCNLERHDDDAEFCKRCGEDL